MSDGNSPWTSSPFSAGLLSGRTALIAGGSGEIGAAICREFGRAGANVAVSYTTHRARAEAVCQEISDKTSVRAEAVFCDYDRRDVLEKLPDAVLESFGSLDFLVNCAGGPGEQELRNVSYEAWAREIQGNLTGPFFLAQNAAKTMEKNESGGCVVNISANSFSRYSHGAYGIAKAAEMTMTRFLARSFAPKVRAYALCPGQIECSEVERSHLERRARESVLQRNVRPFEIGRLCVVLCSELFASATGLSLIADGGFWLNGP